MSFDRPRPGTLRMALGVDGEVGFLRIEPCGIGGKVILRIDHVQLVVPEDDARFFVSPCVVAHDLARRKACPNRFHENSVNQQVLVPEPLYFRRRLCLALPQHIGIDALARRGEDIPALHHGILTPGIASAALRLAGPHAPVYGQFRVAHPCDAGRHRGQSLVHPGKFVLTHSLQQLDFARHLPVDVVQDQPFRGNQPAGVRLSEFFAEENEVRMREAVDVASIGDPGTQLVLEVDRDTLRIALGNELGEAIEAVVVFRQDPTRRFLDSYRGSDDVVGPALLDQTVVAFAPTAVGNAPATAQNGPFDPVSAAVGEDEDTRRTSQLIRAEGVGYRLAHHVNPHVHVLLAHDLRQQHVELVPANLVVFLRVVHQGLLGQRGRLHAENKETHQPQAVRNPIHRVQLFFPLFFTVKGSRRLAAATGMFRR